MIGRSFLRSMATATKSVKPPIQLFGVDGTYANALYSASSENIDQTFNNLSKINDLIAKDPKVNEILTNPALSKDDRSSVIEVISSNLKLDKPIVNFLNVLSENNRLNEFKSIFEKFELLKNAHDGIVEAKITSSKPLDSKILKRLQTSISKSSMISQGQTLKISNVVNPDILGGLVVEVGDKTVDLSISAKIAKLNNTLNEAL